MINPYATIFDKILTLHNIPCAGTDLKVYSSGNPKNPPLIILHGIADTPVSFLSTIKNLSSDLFVIAPEIRGHGVSNCPGNYTFAYLLADIINIFEFFSFDSWFMAGHSMGGHLTSQFAALYPSFCKKVAIIEGLGPPPHPQKNNPNNYLGSFRASIERIAASKNAGSRKTMPSLESAVAKLCSQHPKLNSRMAELIAEKTVKIHHDGSCIWGFDPAIFSLWSTFEKNGSKDFWPFIAAPTLIVWADHPGAYWRTLSSNYPAGWGDWSREEIQQEVLEVIPDADEIMIKDSGHMMNYDQPELLTQELRKFFVET